MIKLGTFSRRSFIKITGIGTGLLIFPYCNHNHNPYYILTGEEVKILDAIADQIIPPDDFPGGKEAGVTWFIDRQLSGFYSDHADMYKKCLAGFDLICKEIYHVSFYNLSSEKQYAYLRDIESGEYNHINWDGYLPSSFFNTLISHCNQGYYGHPRHGGNKNHVSYRMLSLDYPFIIGRNVH